MMFQTLRPDMTPLPKDSLEFKGLEVRGYTPKDIFTVGFGGYSDSEASVEVDNVGLLAFYGLLASMNPGLRDGFKTGTECSECGAWILATIAVIPGANDDWFAVYDTAVIHGITQHGYRVPEKFWDAVVQYAESFQQGIHEEGGAGIGMQVQEAYLLHDDEE